MKKMLLRLKIIFTNLCRVVISFSFVNLIVFGNRIVFGMFQEAPPDVLCYEPLPAETIVPDISPVITTTPTPDPTPFITIPPVEITCYAPIYEPPWYETTVFKIFIILVPIAIVIIGTIIIIRKIKNKNKIKNPAEEIQKDDE